MKNSIKVKDYEIHLDQIIGKGSISSVCCAQHPRHKNICAKILNRSLFSQQVVPISNDLKKTLIEINHENLVKIYDIIEDVNNQEIYIMMQKYERKTLDSDLQIRQQSKQHYTLSEIQEILNQLIQGYYKLYQNRIKTNLQPTKIFINNKNEIAISDYAIGMIINKEVIQGSRIISVHSSPQKLLEPTYSSKSDVFSLGVILYQLLYLKLPFTVKTTKQLLNQFKQLKTQPFKCDKLPEFYQGQDQTKEIVELIEGMLVYSEEERISWQSLRDIFSQAPTQTPDQLKKLDQNIETKDVSITLNLFQEKILVIFSSLNNDNGSLDDNILLFYLIEILASKAELAQQVLVQVIKFIETRLPLFLPFHKSLIISSILGYQYTVLENISGILQINFDLICNEIKQQFHKDTFHYVKEKLRKSSPTITKKIQEFRDESLMQFMYYANIIQKMNKTQEDSEKFQKFIVLVNKQGSDSKMYLKWFEYFYQKLLNKYLNVNDMQNLHKDHLKVLTLILKFSKIDVEFPCHKRYEKQPENVLLKENLSLEELGKIAISYQKFQ